ncbi:MAG: cardiolipin synthase [Phycisphaerae bacterium]
MSSLEWLSFAASGLATLLEVWAVIDLLRRPREPRAMIAWLLVLVLLPVVGLVAYALIGRLRVERARRRRHTRRTPRDPPAAAPHGDRRLDPALGALLHLALRLTGFPATRDNDVTIFHDAEKTYLALQLAIESARHHVHVEYYIFQADETGRAVAELLMKKARDGVRCRVLLDDLGCWRMPRSLVRAWRAAGVEVAFFLPVIPWSGRWHVNLRNHRKIVVVDGAVGFTGSQNIGDEYRGRLKRYAPWRDTHLRIVGPAVHQLQDVFCDDWLFAAGSDPRGAELYPPPRSTGDQLVHVIPSGPDSDAHVLTTLLFAAVGAARSSICITSPYFVPDDAMLLALRSAAYRGVRVQLLIPARSDSRLVLWAGRSYYDELCAAGVEVYEYDAGMLHSKVVVVDQSWALAGSANMDTRSFRLNFEITTVLYDPAPARLLQADFDALRDRSRRVHPLSPRDWRFRESLKLGLARLASPLL